MFWPFRFVLVRVLIKKSTHSEANCREYCRRFAVLVLPMQKQRMFYVPYHRHMPLRWSPVMGITQFKTGQWELLLDQRGWHREIFVKVIHADESSTHDPIGKQHGATLAFDRLGRGPELGHHEVKSSTTSCHIQLNRNIHSCPRTSSAFARGLSPPSFRFWLPGARAIKL